MARARSVAKGTAGRGRMPTASSKFESLARDEASLWSRLEPTAKNAFAFWLSFLDLRMGPNQRELLDAVAISRYMQIVRAVSWVESRHGSGAGSSASKDPMQCGNPSDAWWPQIAGAVSTTDRFIRGPNHASNLSADELPSAAEQYGSVTFPSNARTTILADVNKGHDDAQFTSVISFYWGIPHLLWKTNHLDNRATFKCEPISRDRLIDGAVRYNGGGDPAYRQKILDALTLIGWNSVDAVSASAVSSMVTSPKAAATESVAEKIIGVCEARYPTNNDDCNKFAKAVGAPFFEPDPFQGLDADRMIALLKNSSAGWTDLGKSHEESIKRAKNGEFVIAGMTSGELGDNHGHVAIVVGVDGQASGNVIVPICYAGSLNSAARVRKRRVSETFGATNARDGKISYFSRKPNQTPTETAFSLIMAVLKASLSMPERMHALDGYAVWPAGEKQGTTNKRKRR